MTQAAALRILKTGASVFLTGEPGSGKTHTINQYITYLKAAKVRVAVTASTGIAATHLGGITIHSWSGIGIKRALSEQDVDRIATNERLVRRIARTAVLVIDEVSMLDAHVLASVERVCREVKRSSQPFGGMQVVLVGDFFQLPPVGRDEEAVQFAFASPAWASLRPLVCYLAEQHRQADQEFLDILTALRANAVTAELRARLDERCAVAAAGQMTQLFSHNVDVDRINEVKLAAVAGPAKAFQMSSGGRAGLVEQLKRGCLSPERLTLKIGAAVMFTKNSPKGAFVNGMLGTVVGFNRHTQCPVVEVRSGRQIQTEPAEWMIEENGRVVARIGQLPLRLAWAMTVHKSQGMSLDAAFVDLRQAFVEGQGYVALSRVRSLEGLFLAGYNQQALTVHPEVLARDAEFRQQSLEAAAAFAEMTPADLQQMHHNFLRAAGGRVPRRGSDRAGTTPVFSVEAMREKHANAYRSWREQDDAQLTERYRAGESVRELAERFGRRPGAIRARLRKIGLVAE